MLANWIGDKNNWTVMWYIHEHLRRQQGRRNVLAITAERREAKQEGERNWKASLPREMVVLSSALHGGAVGVIGNEKNVLHTRPPNTSRRKLFYRCGNRDRGSVAVIDSLQNHIRSTNKSHDISSRSAGAAASRPFVITISSAVRGWRVHSIKIFAVRIEHVLVAVMKQHRIWRSLR